ncbi:hypothetical protein ACJX0J_025844, partial [Zea mays]
MLLFLLGVPTVDSVYMGQLPGWSQDRADIELILLVVGFLLSTLEIKQSHLSKKDIHTI